MTDQQTERFVAALDATKAEPRPEFVAELRQQIREEASSSAVVTIIRTDEPRQRFGANLVDDVQKRTDESDTPTEHKRWFGVVAAVAATILAVVGVVLVAHGNRGDVEPDPAAQVPPPSVKDAAASPDVIDPAASPSVFDPVSSYRWYRVPDDDGAFEVRGIFEPGFGGNDRGTYSMHAGRSMASVTVGGPGLVAVGYSGRGGVPETDNYDAAVWTSDDGVTWSAVPHVGSALGGSEAMTSVIAGGPGLVAVGSEASTSVRDGVTVSTRERAAVWTSVDGFTWSRVAHDESVFGGPGGRSMTSVTVGGPGLVAVGAQSEADFALYDSAAPYPGERDLDAAVWTSVDGLSWSRVAHDESVFGGPGDQAMTSVTAGGQGLVAVGWDGQNNTMDAAVWTSVDGITWSRVPDVAATLGGADSQQMNSVATGGPGLVAVGYDGVWDKVTFPEEDNPTNWDWVYDGAAAVWTSVDGTTWTLVSDDAAVFGGANSPQMSGVSAGGPGLVAVGTQELEGTYDLRSVVWTSVDGITWSRVPDDETVFRGKTPQWGTEMTSVTSWGPALVAVGHVEGACCFDSGASDAAVWIATPDVGR